jgi:hypothetical protein
MVLRRPPAQALAFLAAVYIVDLTRPQRGPGEPRERFFLRSDYYSENEIVSNEVKRYTYQETLRRVHLDEKITFWDFDLSRYATRSGLSARRRRK